MAYNSAFFVSLAGCVASWYYTYTYVRITQQGQETNFFNAMYTEYSQPEMLHSLDALHELRDEVGFNAYPYEYFHLKMGNEERGKKLNQARRHITRWYKKVKLMYVKDHLRWDHYGEVLPGRESAAFFIDMLEPLMLADRVGMDRRLSSVFDWYRSQYDLNVSTFIPDKERLWTAEMDRRRSIVGSVSAPPVVSDEVALGTEL
uniref:Uncharacterized protein n=1 Tax=Noctiluca scintillans TaxID=2966 RepID=A0A7S1B1U4_NOCSC